MNVRKARVSFTVALRPLQLPTAVLFPQTEKQVYFIPFELWLLENQVDKCSLSDLTDLNIVTIENEQKRADVFTVFELKRRVCLNKYSTCILRL